MKYISINDYETGILEIYPISNKKADKIESLEIYVEDVLGYNVSNCEYFMANNIIFN